MRILEAIEKSLNQMNPDELAIVYEHIRLIEKIRTRQPVQKPVLSLDEIHKMTASSKGPWSDDVIHDREDRLRGS